VAAGERFPVEGAAPGLIQARVHTALQRQVVKRHEVVAVQGPVNVQVERLISVGADCRGGNVEVILHV
jgi:hypothetical protein